MTILSDLNLFEVHDASSFSLTCLGLPSFFVACFGLSNFSLALIGKEVNTVEDSVFIDLGLLDCILGDDKSTDQSCDLFSSVSWLVSDFWGITICSFLLFL